MNLIVLSLWRPFKPVLPKQMRENPLGEAHRDALRLNFLVFPAGMLAELTVRRVEIGLYIVLL